MYMQKQNYTSTTPRNVFKSVYADAKSSGYFTIYLHECAVFV